MQEQWEDAPFNRILIVTHVEIAEPLRGQDLGLWLGAEGIARMSSPIATPVWKINCQAKGLNSIPFVSPR